MQPPGGAAPRSWRWSHLVSTVIVMTIITTIGQPSICNKLPPALNLKGEPTSQARLRLQQAATISRPTGASHQQLGHGSVQVRSRRSFDGINSATSSTMQMADRNKNPAHQQANRNQSSSSMPEFSAPIGNVSAVLGRDVRLICTVENLGQYQVAWLKEETRTILSIDTNIIITNYRIFLIPDEEARKWVLHIKDVQESDRGFYQCQVNTNPMRSTSGYLEVVVPPSIIEAQTSQMAEVVEHSNVSIQCKGSGHPKPTITWRREDGQPIRLLGPVMRGSSRRMDDIGFQAAASQSMQQLASKSNQALESNPNDNQLATIASQLDDVKSDKLTLIGADRTMAGLYVCSATNGIPGPQATKRIPVYVKFPPNVSLQSKYISVSEHDQLEVDCLIEAYPKADSYWTRQPTSRQHFNSKSKQQRHQLALQVANRLYAPLRGATSREAAQLDQPDPMSLGGSPEPQQRVSSVATLSTHKWLQLDTTGATLSQPPTQFANPTATENGSNSQSIISEDIGPRRAVGSHGWPTLASVAPSAQFMVSDEQLAGSGPSKAIAGSQDMLSSVNQFNGELASPETHELAEMEHSISGGEDFEDQDQIKAVPAHQIGDPLKDRPRVNRVTVKQTPVNPYTWRLRLTIQRMEAEDFGQYTCIAKNQLGSSETSFWVTRADRQESQIELGQQHSTSATPFASSSMAANDLDLYQRDSLMVVSETGNNRRLTSDKGQQQAPVGTRQRLANGQNHRVVYAAQMISQSHISFSKLAFIKLVHGSDENYLQAIKNRGLANGANGNSLLGGRQLQQKLRMKQSSSGLSRNKNLVPELVPILLIAVHVLYFYI